MLNINNLMHKEKRITGDGSFTFFNHEVKECYHSPVGAQQEAMVKYIMPSELAERFKSGAVKILDVCFGLGYNSLSAINAAVKHSGILSITALEIDKTVVRDSSLHIQDNEWKKILCSLYKKGEYRSDNISINIKWGDARKSCSDLIEKGNVFDLIYHDPFSTQRNAELWTVDFFIKLYKLLNCDGQIFTYSTSLPVLSGFITAGFYIGKVIPAGEQRYGLVAAKNIDVLCNPYTKEELTALLKSPKAIPYRDESQTGSNSDILRERNLKLTDIIR